MKQKIIENDMRSAKKTHSLFRQFVPLADAQPRASIIAIDIAIVRRTRSLGLLKYQKTE